ncbi:MAG: glycosyltransferase family 4 protein [Synechococcales cyanobacterium RU_4_20]|nr:glycosyltransferase family 4 protein [Synechococcales cyanobacterium RU_4_20]NJR68707.1 glycosyltransferase family 4 protein [Synechococcales cyanobacterium CRU_2_2]
MKVALVHDYLTQPGGAERVFELLCRRYPEADIYTSIYDAEKTVDFGDRHINTTWLQHIPGAKRHFRLLAPLYFPVFRSLDLRDYDLIISSTTSFAKAVRKRDDAKHICFCHNVTRFLWDTQTYLREFSGLRPFVPAFRMLLNQMRQLDLQSAQQPDLYIANSTTVAERIRRVYGKEAIVINYPIDDQRFEFSQNKDQYFLASARLLSYKRIDVIIEAFNWLGWTLYITGNGPERERLEKQAMPNVKFLGHVSDLERRRLMANAKAVIVAALEDYGLVPVEANASGTPVIAYGAGGVLDTQVHGQTGLLFDRQSPEALLSVLKEFGDRSWNHQEIREHALSKFSQAAFFNQVEQVFDRYLATA